MSKQPAPTKDVTFYDNYVPSLPAGEYQITVSQTLTVDQEQTKKDEGSTDIPSHPNPIDPVTQKFIVRGSRFVIDPADIHRMFPPRNGTGLYHEYLAMMVFNKRALPWERKLSFPDTSKISDEEARKYPWLALLVFTDDELPMPVGSPPAAAGSQQNSTRSTSMPLNEIVADQKPGPPANVQGPSLLKLEDDEDPAKIHANVIDIPADTFVNLLPSLNDLPFLAHVREVSTEDKEPQNLKHDGWYSVILSNRFATPPASDSGATALKNIVHLVSLEGFESLLVQDPPVKPTIERVRMISLASWTYTCLQDPSENFRQLMLDLITANSAQGTDLLVRRPLADPGGVPGVTDTIGVTESLLNGSVTEISLEKKATATIEADSRLYVVAPDGAIWEQVLTQADVKTGDQKIVIEPHQFNNMPKGSLVGPVDAFSPQSPAERIRRNHAVAMTADELQGQITSIALAGPAGAYETIAKGTSLQVVDSSGLNRQTVTASADVDRYATALPIEAVEFKTPMPAGSAIGPLEDYETLARLTDGYVPLSYATWSGEATYAWYRGPLAPVATPSFLPQFGASQNPEVPQTSSAAMVYDQQTGLFDQSFAVAFQTGRSLALASKPFATNLFHWRRRAHAIVDLLHERMRQPQLLNKLQNTKMLDAAGDLASVGVSRLVKLLDGNLVYSSFKDYLATEFSDGLAQRLGKGGGFTLVDRALRPASPAMSPPVTPASLKNVMERPDVRLLLEYASGLAAVGMTAGELSGLLTLIPLAGEGASIELDAGTILAVVSPDGSTRAVVTVAQAIQAGVKAIPIESYNFAPALPAQSRVLLGDESMMPDQIVQWLAQLALLYNVPFNNLIPDARMLPEGSIRFFYLDPNWIASLLDGALSVAIQTSRDGLLHKQMRDPLHRAVNGVLHQVRERRRAVTVTGAPLPSGTLAGFVLRSSVVSGWPGLEVRAWSESDSETPMKPLRLDRVSPSVMIGIFPDVPVKIEFNEPREGLVFGQEDEGIALRYVTGDKLGQVIDPENPTWLSPVKRANPKNNPALKIGGDGGLAKALAGKFPDPKPTLTPASFAIQMVKVPEEMLFMTNKGVVR